MFRQSYDLAMENIDWDRVTDNPHLVPHARSVIERRKKAREEARDPRKIKEREQAARVRVIFDKNTIRREEFEIQERQMTSSEMKKEEKLKDKYDDSEMKANFIKQYGEKKGKQYYFAYIRKKAMAEAIELLDEAKRTKAERLQANIEKDKKRTRGGPRYDKEGKPIPRGAIHAFDVDETIFSHGVKGKPNVQVHVNDPSGKRVQSLTNQEFNVHKLPKGHSYDFGEFRSAKKFAQTTTPNKSVVKKIKKLQKRGKRVQLITARDKFDNPEAFRQHFVRHGINVKPGDIHYTGGMKGSDVGQKKVAVAQGLAKMHGASSIHMYDDAAKVHKAFEAEKGKSRKLKIKTHLAKPNKRGEVMLRSYQATKEDFELWIENLLDEGYDLSEFTVDDLYEAFEEILDEASKLTTTGASGDDKGPHYRNPKPKLPKFGYTDKFTKPSKKLKEETELTPYEFWKSFISEDEDVVDECEVEETELEEEIELTPYDVWKRYCSERMGK